jgi:hypothetical protein
MVLVSEVMVMMIVMVIEIVVVTPIKDRFAYDIIFCHVQWSGAAMSSWLIGTLTRCVTIHAWWSYLRG